MPYFEMRLEEVNGEQEYSYDCIILAKDLQEAAEIADRRAREFYDDPYNADGEYVIKTKEDGGYYHLGGCIFVEVAHLMPTTKEEWMEEQFRKNLLKGGKDEITPDA